MDKPGLASGLFSRAVLGSLKHGVYLSVALCLKDIGRCVKPRSPKKEKPFLRPPR
jgi:hypothetical protein